MDAQFLNLNKKVTKMSDFFTLSSGESVVGQTEFTNARRTLEPNRWYSGFVTRVELEDPGQYYTFPMMSPYFEVLSGDYKGSSIRLRMRLFDTDPKVSDRAKKFLAVLDAGCGNRISKGLAKGGKLTPENLEKVLIGKKFIFFVTVFDRQDGDSQQGASFPFINSIKLYTKEEADRIDAIDLERIQSKMEDQNQDDDYEVTVFDRQDGDSQQVASLPFINSIKLYTKEEEESSAEEASSDDDYDEDIPF